MKNQTRAAFHLQSGRGAKTLGMAQQEYRSNLHCSFSLLLLLGTLVNEPLQPFLMPFYGALTGNGRHPQGSEVRIPESFHARIKT